MRILFFGDLVGLPGRIMLQKHLPHIKNQLNPDFILVNGENSASDGRGITPKIMHFFKHVGVHLVTSGNHIFAKKDIYGYLRDHQDLVRPLNFPGGCPGTGVTTITNNGKTLGIINVQGRVFMRELLSCPFRATESALTFLKGKTNAIFVDMHAETSSEKMGLGHYFDGKVSVVVGTHTHVQTADERILPGGTAFITDVGMAGALNSMIGMKKETVITNMLTQMPSKFEVDLIGPFQLCAVMIDIDDETGKATKIERLRIIDHEMVIQSTED
jgi:metallophosphoesterase (TIGR00282 family)